METKINLKNAEITIKVIEVTGGYRVQSTLKADNGQNSIAYGKVYKSKKLAEKDAVRWEKYQR